MTATLDVWTDPELTELARADPTLIAIADALTEAAPAANSFRSQRQLPRRRVTYIVLAAAVVVASAIPAVALSRGLQSFLGLISNPPVARNWVQATLIEPIPTNAPAGRTVIVRWKLWSRDQNGKIVPFGATDLFARIVNPTHTQATRAPARCHNGRKAMYCHDGRFYARIRVPSGGIGSIQVGIMGWSNGPSGTSKPAPGLFPITNNP